MCLKLVSQVRLVRFVCQGQVRLGLVRLVRLGQLGLVCLFVRVRLGQISQVSLLGQLGLVRVRLVRFLVRVRLGQGQVRVSQVSQVILVRLVRVRLVRLGLGVFHELYKNYVLVDNFYITRAKLSLFFFMALNS